MRREGTCRIFLSTASNEPEDPERQGDQINMEEERGMVIAHSTSPSSPPLSLTHTP